MKTLLGALGVLGAVLGLTLAQGRGGTSADGPEPITFGRDTCARCRMHISGPGYAGELRDVEGKLHKYDDLGCLLIATWEQHREVPGAWIEDHAGGGFAPLASAWLVWGEHPTPMGYGVVGFTTEAAARQFAKARGGEVGRVEDVMKDRRRFRRAATHEENHR
jgi:copper chaperone NosL